MRFKSCGQFELGLARKASVKKIKCFFKEKVTSLLPIKPLESIHMTLFSKTDIKNGRYRAVQAKTENRR